jgi:hypothetical protein
MTLISWFYDRILRMFRILSDYSTFVAVNTEQK